jgi:hypothetical protein
MGMGLRPTLSGFAFRPAMSLAHRNRLGARASPPTWVRGRPRPPAALRPIPGAQARRPLVVL